MQSFTVPACAMPLPEFGTSAAMATVERDQWEWGDHFRLITTDAMRNHLFRTRPHYTTALYYPRADHSHLLAPNRYMLWAFIVDDMCDDAISDQDEQTVAGLTSELIGVSRGEREAACDASRALVDVLGDLTAGRSPRWRRLLGETNASWIRTYLTEVRASRARRVMDFNEYLPHRRLGVDELMFHHLAEYVHGIELPAAVRNLPAMRQARNRSSEWIGLYNDIYSAPKEAAVGYVHNAVLIVREHRSCSLQEAADIVADVANRLMVQFEAAVAAVPGQLQALPEATPEVIQDVLVVLEGYRHLVRGNWDYHIDAARYLEAETYIPQAQGGVGLRPTWSTADVFRAAD
ncbi:terpene synthase family protein [Streptomyces iconiensis]|uniref:Terpene synthase n=1 Tax=Streptomyces iconiensis TaxID=1384038 RepID=A0ABT7A7E7_9ACTN|nr:hypothetical protein [Streptomyces iconiensis]MDJ1137249.1 hypothetical protein [Streptomyces iconiensis]